MCFCLECKRLNVRVLGEERPRPYFSEYVRFGMLRFVRGQYASAARSGGMLAFVLDANVSTAMAGILGNIHEHRASLGMSPPVDFWPSSIRPADTRIRETVHCRERDLQPFTIHHLFMRGDPSVPMLPEPSPKPPKLPKRSRKPRK
jgi:hypothetical protein